MLACTKRLNGVLHRRCIPACHAVTSVSVADRCPCPSTLLCSRLPCPRSSSNTPVRTNRNLTVPTSSRLCPSSPAEWDRICGLILKLASAWICASTRCLQLLLHLHQITPAPTTLHKALRVRRCQRRVTTRLTVERSCLLWCTHRPWCPSRSHHCHSQATTMVTQP